ncbi:GNAT family N-acetyltransferase (plasmid) [Streptomyces sp. BI20]|uniref:GNAT family N-acetyltransferase n=1 Tax=Streptomyces sp. BI20 TaxID=3403460 RepID=UPI003C7957C3
MPDPGWRPLAPADAAALAELRTACDAADGSEPGRRSTDEAREDLTAPGVDLPTGSASLWHEGRPIAHALVRAREHADGTHRMTLDLAVHPAHRSPALTRALLDRARASAIRRHEELYPGRGLELHARTHHGQGPLAEVLDAAGYRRARTYRGMRADLAGPAIPAAPRPPDGTRLVPFDDTFDAALLALRNEVFADTWGSVPMSPVAWRHTITGSPYFRPASSCLLLPADGGRKILSYLLCTEPPRTGPGLGPERVLYLANAGTRTGLHGKGLYRAVFAHTLARARAEGRSTAVLDVDTENPMASGGFYTRRGFVTFRTWTTHVLRVVDPPTRWTGASAG